MVAAAVERAGARRVVTAAVERAGARPRGIDTVLIYLNIFKDII